MVWYWLVQRRRRRSATASLAARREPPHAGARVPVRRETIDVRFARSERSRRQHGHVRAPARRRLDRVLFTEGQRVSAGQTAGRIDPRPYEVALTQAQGQMKENEARLKNAEGDLARYTKLEAQDLITGQQVTTQEALVQQYRGALQANEAQVNNARLQLSYKIVAPIDGRLGLRQVDAGNLVGTQRPQRHRRHHADASDLGALHRAGSELPAVLDGLRKMPHAGRGLGSSDTTKFTTACCRRVDNQIDTTTGTIKLRARFDNADDAAVPEPVRQHPAPRPPLPDATVIPSAACSARCSARSSTW